MPRIQELPYIMLDDGRKAPLPGVAPVFLRGTTAQAAGLCDERDGAASATDAAPSAAPTWRVAREQLLADIQFRGATSDWHPIKSNLVTADYDPLLVKSVEGDAYGDGSNFEVACTRAAADAWERAAAALAQEAAAQADGGGAAVATAAADDPPPPRKWHELRKPWVDLGTAAQMEEEAGASSRGVPIVLRLQRPWREVSRPCAFSDTDTAVLAQHAPYLCGDAGDVLRMERDSGVQAAPVLQEASAQAAHCRPRPKATQTAAADLPTSAKADIFHSESFRSFMARVRPRLECALQQNCAVDIFTDELAALGDEDGGGGGGDAACHKDGGVREAQTFTDLAFSKGKVVSCIQWLPHRRGCLIASVTDAADLSQRAEQLHRPGTSHLLVWSFRDPIRPEVVLESPHDVFALKCNPSTPDLLAGGAYSGQLILWDLASAPEPPHSGATRGAAPAAAAAAAGLLGDGDGGGEDAAVRLVKHKALSAVECSHKACITALEWLPGAEVDRNGMVTQLATSSGHATGGVSQAGGSAAASHVGCCFLATIATDGKVMFWDVRVERLSKKGRKPGDAALDVSWRPVHVVPLLNLYGNDFAGTCMGFSVRSLLQAEFVAGSRDGELMQACFTKPEGGKTDYATQTQARHAGAVVALLASPFMDDLLLSVGDWTFQLWLRDFQQPLVRGPCHTDCYTAACWSPTRPCVFFTADVAGVLLAWDLAERSHEPALRFRAARSAVTSLAFNTPHPLAARAPPPPPPAAGVHATAAVSGSTGAPTALLTAPPAGGVGVHPSGAASQFLALGDGAGALHVLDLPRNLRRPLPSEHSRLAALVAREAARATAVAAEQAKRTATAKSTGSAGSHAAGDGAAAASAGDALGASAADVAAAPTAAQSPAAHGSGSGAAAASAGAAKRLINTTGNHATTHGAGSWVLQVVDAAAADQADKAYAAMEKAFLGALAAQG